MIRLVTIQGSVIDPKDVVVEGIVIRILPGEQHTTPDAEGHFSFHNMRAVTYMVAVDQNTVPEFGVLKQPQSVCQLLDAIRTLGSAASTLAQCRRFQQPRGSEVGISAETSRPGKNVTQK